MKKIIVILLAAAFAATLFSGCDEGGMSHKSRTFRGAMGTDGSLVAYADFSGDPTAKTRFEELESDVEELLYSIDSSLDVNDGQSFISKFNAASGGETVELDYTAYTVLKISLDAYDFTEGYYNPAVYYGVQDFGFAADGVYPEGTEQLPNTETTDKYSELASHFPEVSLSQKDGAYYATKPQYTQEIDGGALALKIDLGGVGKGYAVDMINSLMREHGFDYGYFSFGSSSIALGKYPSGDFDLQFVHPRAYGKTYLSVPMSDKLLSTSGDYEKYYLLDGQRYCHIFDPFTCRPIQTGMTAATVIGGTAAEDDAISTALMAMPPEKAVEFIKNKLETRQVAITCEIDQKNYFYTNMQEGFKLLDSTFLPLEFEQTAAFCKNINIC